MKGQKKKKKKFTIDFSIEAYMIALSTCSFIYLKVFSKPINYSLLKITERKGVI